MLDTPYGGKSGGKNVKSLTYDYNGHKGVALWQFTITEKGKYNVAVGGNTQADPDAKIAFGRSIGKSTAIGRQPDRRRRAAADRGHHPADRRPGEAQPHKKELAAARRTTASGAYGHPASRRAYPPLRPAGYGTPPPPPAVPAAGTAAPAYPAAGAGLPAAGPDQQPPARVATRRRLRASSRQRGYAGTHRAAAERAILAAEATTRSGSAGEVRGRGPAEQRRDRRDGPGQFGQRSPLSACAPSHSAVSGCGCTSTMTPSAPAAMPARASGTTRSRRPAACDGSTITGRWLSRCTIAIADTSSMLRIDGSNDADPALAQHDVEVAALRDVLGGHQPFLVGRGQPALEHHRLAGRADRLQQREVLHVARADLQHVGVLGDDVDVGRRRAPR